MARNREWERWGEVVRTRVSVEAFADELSLSMRETEAKISSKDSGLSIDGTDVNTNEVDCGNRKDHKLSENRDAYEAAQRGR